MTLNPGLILAAGQNNSIGVPELVRQSAQTYDMLQSMPLMQRQRELGVQAQEQGLAQQQQQQAQSQEMQKAQILLKNAQYLKNLPVEQRRTYIANLDPEVLNTFGIDQKRIGAMQLDDVSLDNTIAQLSSVLPQIQQQRAVQSSDTLYGGRVELQKGTDGSIKYFEYGQEIPQDQVKQRLDSARKDYAIEQQELSGSRRRGALDEELDVKPQISGRSETAKLEAQLDKLPEVKAAVAKAEADARLATERGEEGRKNNIAFDLYNTAMRGLVSGLEGTETGAVVGRFPAVTANQQIADGAVAAMAPVLKQMFRTAGEGTFTDKDQELLLAMVPTRKDLPEARRAKVNNITAIVQAKLGSGQQQAPQQQNPAPSASGGIKFLGFE